LPGSCDMSDGGCVDPYRGRAQYDVSGTSRRCSTTAAGSRCPSIELPPRSTTRHLVPRCSPFVVLSPSARISGRSGRFGPSATTCADSGPLTASSTPPRPCIGEPSMPPAGCERSTTHGTIRRRAGRPITSTPPPSPTSRPRGFLPATQRTNATVPIQPGSGPDPDSTTRGGRLLPPSQ